MILREGFRATAALRSLSTKFSGIAALTLVIAVLFARPVTSTQSGVAVDRRESAAAGQLIGLLRQFLEDAGRGNRAGFDKFFADDVIYTRSSGLITNKTDIMRSVEKLKPTEESKTRYSAEDIVVHDYADTAVVAFRLVAQTEHKTGKVEIAHYRNTGTFLRRNGVWQAVAWQSTKTPQNPTHTNESSH